MRYMAHRLQCSFRRTTYGIEFPRTSSVHRRFAQGQGTGNVFMLATDFLVMSKTSSYFNETTRRCITEGSHLHTYLSMKTLCVQEYRLYVSLILFKRWQHNTGTGFSTSFFRSAFTRKPFTNPSFIPSNSLTSLASETVKRVAMQRINRVWHHNRHDS
jgi:hypothetical protein